MILSALESEPLSVQDLAEQVGASASTIRRDLARLARNGQLIRVYGGAMSHDGNARESPYAEEFDRDVEPKETVAARAAAMVEDGDVVMLDIGTTTARLARHLRGRPVTVITSSLTVFDVLRDDTSVEIVLLGGLLRRNFHTLVGTLTAAALNQVSAEKLFLGCSGVRPDGKVVDDVMVEASTKRGMIEAAQQVILLASGKKFPGKGSIQVCDLSEVNTVVTTDGPHLASLTDYQERGGEVLIA
jgi:DeoR/GlpR family transcriptional regulator of sugar metabolism